MNPALPTVLLVDDDDTLRRLLARNLEGRGWRVLQAASGTEALAQAHAGRPSHAVLDLKLPGETGLALIQSLRQALPRIHIVMLTGYASISTAVEAIKLGAANYLAKPAGADDICAALTAGADTGSAAAPVTLASTPLSVRRLEWEHIQRVLHEHGGNIAATARALNMHRRTLQRKLAKRPPAAR